MVSTESAQGANERASELLRPPAPPRLDSAKTNVRWLALIGLGHIDHPIDRFEAPT